MKQQLILILVALSFNVVDLITGFISALYNKDIQSSRLRDGLFKKVGFIFCYLLAFMVDTEGKLIGLNLGVDILPGIITVAVITEISSVIENICKINNDFLPDKLKDLFHMTKEGEE